MKSLTKYLVLASLYVFTSPAFALTATTSAVITEKFYPLGSSGVYYDDIPDPQIEFTITNTTGSLITSFAISNSGAFMADFDSHGAMRGWVGSAIYFDGADWRTQDSDTLISELSGHLVGATKGFYFGTGGSSIGSELTPAPILPGEILGSFWGATTTGLESQFVTIGENEEGFPVISTGETTVVPLPASFLLLLSGLSGLGIFRWKNSQKFSIQT